MTIKQLKKSIEQTEVLKDISASYADVASGRFKRIRKRTEKNRLYLEELSQVYQSVKQEAAQKRLLPAKNSKTINIVITSNYQFYGDINYKLIKFFIGEANSSLIGEANSSLIGEANSSLIGEAKNLFIEKQSTNSDTIIVGKTGAFYLKKFKYASKFDEFNLKKDFPATEELNQLVEKIQSYSQILVYYSKLQSVILQIPTVTDITQTSILKEDSPDSKERPFIFEPEIIQVLGFFEAQVKGLLLQQAFLESELARTGARVLVMDKAKDSAQKFIDQDRSLLNLGHKTEVNNNILQTTVAMKALQEGI